MKKLFLFFALIAAAGCQYDDQWIKDEFTELEERIKDLEEVCDGLNSDIKALEDIIKAISSNDFISDVTTLTESGRTIGYKISFVSGKEICIYNGIDGKDGQDGTDGKDGQDGTDGKDGADGKDGYIPEISVRQDTDGQWYWTIDGEWMLDEEGNKISTTGRTDLAPMLKIEELYWYVSYDGGYTWSKLGKATGENGTSYFKEIKQDDDYVYITLIDGNTITIAKASSFSIDLGISEDIPCLPLCTLNIPYRLEGAGDNPEVITMSEGLWNAKVVANSPSEGFITIYAPEDISEGKVIVIASNGTKTIVRSLTFVEGICRIADDSAVLSAKGGDFTISLSTNFDYEIETTASWIRHLDTKTIRNESVTFRYDALPQGISTRSAMILFKDLYCGTVKTVEVCQGSLISLNKNNMMLFRGEEDYLTANVLSGNQDVVWTSSDSDIVWVSQEGKIIAISEGTATIKAMTADYRHSAECVVTVGNISDYIYLKQGSATNISYSDGYVHSGTKLSWYFYNNSSAEVYVKYLQIVDAYGEESNRMAVEDTIAPGRNSGWVITLGKSYKAPKCKATYEYKGKEYSTICGHAFN
ncbi:MAG: Ig-like domain-containing protein [Bacteroidales bacterium]|nr:Ig-like domain-containing protein [Bacteroidales bacterium]